MNVQPVREGQLHAYVDGELDSAAIAEVETLLAREPATADLVRALRAQKAMLHGAFDDVLHEPLPDRLVRRADGRAKPWRFAPVLVSLLIGGAIGWMLRATQESPPAVLLPRQAAVAHAVFTPEVRHPVEVAASEEAHLVGWLSKRLGAPVRAPKLYALGYELLGGRLLPESGKPGAQFMYQNAAGRRLTLYVSTDVDNRESAFRYTRENGLHVFYWIDGRLGYALSGDIDKQEILRVARAVYEQLNP